MSERITHSRIPGFTLLELLVVVALIAILSGMVTMLLLRSTIPANEASAICSLRVIGLAESQFRLRNPYYGTLTELEEGNFITDPGIVRGDKSGYLFQVIPGVDEVVKIGKGIEKGKAIGIAKGKGKAIGRNKGKGKGKNSKYQWYAEAVPLVYDSTGVKSFYTDERGNIRAKDTGSDDFESREKARLWPPME